MKIVLGSKSPRRKEILALMGYEFEVRTSDAEEVVTSSIPSEVCASIAKQKNNNIEISDEELLITADTIVALDNQILGKPKDKADAYKMIKMLQGNMHTVYTAVVVRYKEHIEEFVEEANVVVYPMSEDEINAYINTDEPYDKAGAYAIQGIFAEYINAYTGDYYTIMGLPKEHLEEVLDKFKETL